MRAAPLGLRDGDRERLESWVRSSRIAAGLAQRARIVLLAVDGHSNVEVAERVGCSLPTVTSWRTRYCDGGLDALDDRPRSGRPRTLDHRAIVAATLQKPPKASGVTHSSSRLLARRLKIGDATVARVWREYGIQPWRCETFKFSTNPELVAKVTDVVGLYLASPENAVVLCVDEKSQIQAFDAPTTLDPLGAHRQHAQAGHPRTPIRGPATNPCRNAALKIYSAAP